MRVHDFDEVVLNEKGNSIHKKYNPVFYPEDVIPMWIADADFLSPEPVVKAICERAAMEFMVTHIQVNV